MEKKLKLREEAENVERDRRMNMEEENKYDFGSYLLDKSKGLGISRHKPSGGRTTGGGKKSGFAGIGGISGLSGSKPPTSTAKPSGMSTLISQDKTPTKRKTGVTKR